MSNQQLYDQDFYAWANEQAALLRAGRLAEADIQNIAEAIESIGRSEKRELVSRLTTLLLHLLKWQFQPGLSGGSWRASINNARDDIGDHLKDNPSLKSLLDEAIISTFRRARRQAADESGLPQAVFPIANPWTFDQIKDPGFWPEAP